ncbi:hypothetical protein [Vibrio sp. 10N.239.312.D08]|uniref:hypothetical protein n=1 Tax=Vibrio sp. 10N.239.312.D08 TaxID=3229978 RepID=UPI00354F69D3
MAIYVLSLGITCFFVLLFLRFFTNKADILMFKRGHSSLVIALGSIGTPIHEIGHAITAVLFGHKVLKVELFNPKPNGQLGVVHHSYDPSKFYHRIGCFFIGIAPIFSGLIACWVLTSVLWPEFSVDELVMSVSRIIQQDGLISAVEWFYRNTFSSHLDMWLLDWKRYLLWAVLVTSVVKHMLPSMPDMDGVKRGVIHFTVFLYICYCLFPNLVSNFLESQLLFLLSILVVFVAYVVMSQLVILGLSQLLYIRKKRKCLKT